MPNHSYRSFLLLFFFRKTFYQNSRHSRNLFPCHRNVTRCAFHWNTAERYWIAAAQKPLEMGLRAPHHILQFFAARSDETIEYADSNPGPIFIFQTLRVKVSHPECVGSDNFCFPEKTLRLTHHIDDAHLQVDLTTPDSRRVGIEMWH